MKTKFLLGLAVLAWLLAALATDLAAQPEVKLIDAETLKGMLGNPQVIIIDVRSANSYADSDEMIKGAVRQDPRKVSIWAKGLSRNKTIVLYCA